MITREDREKARQGYSGLSKAFWIVPPYSAFLTIQVAIRGTSEGGGMMNAGSSYAMIGVGWFISAFIIRDWVLMWKRRHEPKVLNLDRVGMKRNASHPDWLRSYQKKPRIQKRSTLP